MPSSSDSRAGSRRTSVWWEAAVGVTRALRALAGGALGCAACLRKRCASALQGTRRCTAHTPARPRAPAKPLAPSALRRQANNVAVSMPSRTRSLYMGTTKRLTWTDRNESKLCSTPPLYILNFQNGCYLRFFLCCFCEACCSGSKGPCCTSCWTPVLSPCRCKVRC